MSQTAETYDAPAATRATAPGWRDPRMWIGVAIVAVSVVVGARVVGGADATIAVWAAADEMGAGDTVLAADLVQRRVHFDSDEDAARYLAADQPLPEATQLTRSVGAGELLPVSALGSQEDSGSVEVPLAVALVPPSVRAGSVVNVWVTPPPGSVDTKGEGLDAQLVLEEVVVIEAPRASDDFGATGDRQLVVAVPPEQTEELSVALGAAAAGTVTVTRQG